MKKQLLFCLISFLLVNIISCNRKVDDTIINQQYSMEILDWYYIHSPIYKNLDELKSDKERKILEEILKIKFNVQEDFSLINESYKITSIDYSQAIIKITYIFLNSKKSSLILNETYYYDGDYSSTPLLIKSDSGKGYSLIIQNHKNHK